jgi:hypothetical protein
LRGDHSTYGAPNGVSWLVGHEASFIINACEQKCSYCSYKDLEQG